MKILAVRVSEVGCFSKPVALEGLGDGLNVLAGANEAGKSTILAALRMAFEREHKTTHRDVEALRPHSGGAPLVEVDFAIGETVWRLRKRYLASRMAELANLSTGQIARGADAEAQLTELLGRSAGRSALPLVWAGQGQALTPEEPSADAASTLKRSVTAEISATVGGDARNVRAAIRAELDQFLTNHKPPRPKGEYDAAIKACERLSKDVELASGRRDAAVSRLDRLAELKTAEADLCDPQRQAALADAVSTAEAAAAAAREAAQKHRMAAEAVSAAQSRLDLATARRDSLAAGIKSADTLCEEITLDQDAARDLASSLAAAESHAAEAREARDAARSAATASDAELKAAIESERRFEAQQRLIELSDVHAAAETAIAAGLELRARLDAIRVTPDIMKTLRTESDAVRRLEDRLSAAAPKMRIAYTSGGAARVSQAGAAVPEGELVIDRPIVLTIEGVGTIEIAPGTSQTTETAQDDLARHREGLARTLMDIAVPSLEEAEEQLAERQRLEIEIGEARARLNALVPAGVAKLKAEIETLSLRVGSGEIMDARLRGDVEIEVETARAALAEATSSDDAAQRQLAREREASARHAATAAGRLTRLSKLEEVLPPATERAAKLGELSLEAAGCEQALNEVVREHAAWRELAPDAARLAALQSDAARAIEAQRVHDRQRDDVRRTVASLEGELRADRNDDVEAKVAELEGALATAKQKRTRLEDEVAALQLLDAELQAEENASRDQYLKPVTDRLAPFVNLVFPGAGIVVAENFTPAGLLRGNEIEAISALSGGSQEQIAVMVRLAFGRLMADAGNAVPVVLDDALVYSDDERILRMFAALITASIHHQVIVFTCRSRTFASLDGRRLAIEPWLPDAQATPRLSISA